MAEGLTENLTQLTDAELMSRLGGSLEERDGAFRELWRRHYDRAVRIIRSRLREAGFGHLDEQDFAQQAFTRLYVKYDRYNSDKPFLPWFHTVVRNSVLGELRRERKRRAQEPLADTLAARGSSPQEQSELQDVFAQLSEQDRADFLAMYQQGEKPAQIARRTRRSTSQVYQSLHRIREQLRLLLSIPPPGKKKRKLPPNSRDGDDP
jgi:RNA polymerase sigma factor (sigma-70 family)